MYDGLDLILGTTTGGTDHNIPFDDNSKSKPTGKITKSATAMGETSEVPLKDIVKAMKKNVNFKLAVILNVGHTVGQGFFISTDKATTEGKKADGVIRAFDDEWDLDTLNQKIARDVWASGNAFLNIVGKEGIPIEGIFMLPLSSFQRVNREESGNVVSFLQQWGSKRKTIPAGDISHFAWLPFDEEPFGEGLGQILLRDGFGYKTEAGNTVKREPWIQAQEKMDDVAIKMVYAGLPRYYIYFEGENADDDFVNTETDKFNKLDPLQHYGTNVKTDVKTISLDTQNRFDSFIRNISDRVIAGTMSPISRLWSNIDFTFASAKEATKEMFPLFSMYQRAHKKFMEKMILRPLLEQEGVDWKQAKVDWNWGAPESLTVDQIKQIWEIVRDPNFKGKFDPGDIVDMLNDAGAKLSAPQAREDVKQDVNELNRLISKQDKGKTHAKIKDLPAQIQDVIYSYTGK